MNGQKVSGLLQMHIRVTPKGSKETTFFRAYQNSISTNTIDMHATNMYAVKNRAYHPSVENKLCFLLFDCLFVFFAILFFILWKNFSFCFGCSRGTSDTADICDIDTTDCSFYFFSMGSDRKSSRQQPSS